MSSSEDDLEEEEEEEDDDSVCDASYVCGAVDAAAGDECVVPIHACRKL
jgi:hypothetical protein